MKIAICSDVHLEFGQLELENTDNADVLVLSGDICTAKDLRITDSILSSAQRDRYMEFFTACSKNFPHVVYVMGNHEHYHGDFAESIVNIKGALKHLENIHVLDKEVWELDDHVFIGGTLWTDMNGEDEMTMHHVQRRMNDFQICKNSSRVVNYKTYEPKQKPEGMSDEEFNLLPYEQRYKNVFKTREATLCPQDAVVDHKAMLKVIEEVYANTPPWKTVVVCTHHAPSKGSEHPRYAHDTLMNGAYNSNLDNFIMDRPGIKLWTHGHTHEDFDYMIKSCRVVCNPRGYINYEDRADRFQLKVVEV
jgi:DNA repair exonuclease SbcCD nuclease subunit